MGASEPQGLGQIYHGRQNLLLPTSSDCCYGACGRWLKGVGVGWMRFGLQLVLWVWIRRCRVFGGCYRGRQQEGAGGRRWQRNPYDRSLFGFFGKYRPEAFLRNS